MQTHSLSDSLTFRLSPAHTQTQTHTPTRTQTHSISDSLTFRLRPTHTQTQTHIQTCTQTHLQSDLDRFILRLRLIIRFTHTQTHSSNHSRTQNARMSQARRWFQHSSGGRQGGMTRARSRPDCGDVSGGLPVSAFGPQKSFFWWSTAHRDI